jgi:hydrogenase maturation factor HypF (carbamoyltransferase family)
MMQTLGNLLAPSGVAWSSGLEWDDRLAPVKEFHVEDRNLPNAQLEKKINSPMTSGMGRLFDAAAALAGVRKESIMVRQRLSFECVGR